MSDKIEGLEPVFITMLQKIKVGAGAIFLLQVMLDAKKNKEFDTMEFALLSEAKRLIKEWDELNRA